MTDVKPLKTHVFRQEAADLSCSRRKTPGNFSFFLGLVLSRLSLYPNDKALPPQGQSGGSPMNHLANYISRHTLIRSMAALSILGVACMTASAQTLTLDNFKHGSYTKALTPSQPADTHFEPLAANSPLGAARETVFAVGASRVCGAIEHTLHRQRHLYSGCWFSGGFYPADCLRGDSPAQTLHWD